MNDDTAQHQPSGVPADGSMDTGDREPLGRPGRNHWLQATVPNAGLDQRANIYFAIVEMTRMPMVLTDPNQDDNPIVFVNNAFQDLTGYEESEILGRNCRFLQGAETNREDVRGIRASVENHQPFSTEIVNYRKDGTSFWNAVFIAPVFDPDGKLIYFFASQLDVTRRRESDSSYRQAQKMEAVGQLTAGIAHDFNNLLHIITGGIERLVAKRGDRDVFDRYTSAIAAAADRGTKLTKQLLAFARRSRLDPKNVDLSDLIQGVTELLDSTATAKVELQLNLRRRLPAVVLDPIHLEMALINIVVNARDASQEGGLVTISTRMGKIRGEGGLPEKDAVVLAVSDEGAGMPDFVKVRATEPFFTTKGSGHGTGLGLAMVQGFVQQTGGKLEIDSAEGQGTTIRMLFPVAKEAAPDALPGFKAAKMAIGHAPLILIVDDMHDAASYAAEILTEVGYHTIIANSGEAGLEALAKARESGPVEMVFTDVLMPGGMTGIAFAAEIKRLYPSTPVLLTTGYNNDMVQQGPAMTGMDVLGKPYRRNELVDRVQAALRNSVHTGPTRKRSDYGHAEG